MALTGFKITVLVINIVLLVSIIACTPVEKQSNSEIHTIDNQENKSKSEKSMQYDEHIYGVVAELRKILKGRVAGIYVEYQPKFTVVVRLKGKENIPKKASDFAVKYPIRYEMGAEYTVDELIESYEQHFEKIKALLPSMQGIGVDEKHGQIVINILPQDAENIATQNQVKAILAKPIRFEIQQSATVDASSIN